jgi:hypothetical protein
MTPAGATIHVGISCDPAKRGRPESRSRIRRRELVRASRIGAGDASSASPPRDSACMQVR